MNTLREENAYQSVLIARSVLFVLYLNQRKNVLNILVRESINIIIKHTHKTNIELLFKFNKITKKLD